ncbi:MAG: hypothetical protein J6E46_13680 [Faecalicoccus sp.]|nr:hypothetical protein [Faecalicoccus sp.]
MKRILSAVIILCMLLTGCESDQMKAAKESYNTEKTRIEKQQTELNDLIKEINAYLDEDPIPLMEEDLTNLQEAVKKAEDEIVEIPPMPDSEKEINDLVDQQLKKIDYSKTIEDLQTKKENLEQSAAKFELLNAPSQDFIISRLKEVESIKEIEAVTEDNDPNGNLNKAGGYTSQVYFLDSAVDQSKVYGDTLIDKGTDCGGSVEVYKTVEDAQKRDVYLGAFDNTVFVSGSHIVVGTCVIRTSQYLTASQQQDLEQRIIDALTRIDEKKD